MKQALFLGITFCLLFRFPSCLVIASAEDREEHQDAAVGPALSPLKLGLSICAMKADAGPCKALHTRYHFDILTRQCEIFDYGGCEGNENNFLTLEECQATCLVPDLPEKKKKARFKKEKPSFCLLENDPGICRGLISRHFYNKESQQCEKFMYGGCLGNQNNFESLKECQDICQDSPNLLQMEDEKLALASVANQSSPSVKQGSAQMPSFCMTSMDRGLCRANEKRFFYNHTAGKCHPFSYSGCGGNVNNFTSRKSCLRMCKKGFMKNQRGQQGLMKIRRKRKKQPVKLTEEEIVIERI
ncbi:tissue factor pathway inhibitor isoform X2 [Eublepharis macularius]|uniref:Tissue factor pathway inhibitor n=1 Tax=Eublepharis macularius TaxID=481883 RepID=A0AA97KN93_EUBMA|nr:tissue factor pathway inhibitor isoform X2 [Eublepharis macularius]